MFETMEGVPLVVRMNEFADRRSNRNVPWTPEEIAADARSCGDAGASAVHFHGRSAEGAGDHSAATLGRTLELIADACELVTYCTLGAGTDLDRHERLATLTDAALRPDLAPVDLGSFNLDPFDRETNRFLTEEGLYVNTVGTVHHLAEGIAGAGVVPSAVAWGIGSLRLLGALLDEGRWPKPVYTELVVSDRLLVTNPATPTGLEQLASYLPDVPVTWTVMCAGGSILPLIDAAVALGGGLAFGLGDSPYTVLGGTPRNAEVVATVVAHLETLGRRPATPDELRDRLGLDVRPPRPGGGV
jgi:3-keto-5-aminohexanoate cleavage enzyme